MGNVADQRGLSCPGFPTKQYGQRTGDAAFVHLHISSIPLDNVICDFAVFLWDKAIGREIHDILDQNQALEIASLDFCNKIIVCRSHFHSTPFFLLRGFLLTPGLFFNSPMMRVSHKERSTPKVTGSVKGIFQSEQETLKRLK